MLLTITTTHQPATDLGYLLHKNPARLQTLELTAGQAHIFYPEATAARCTVALLLDIDPIGLVRSQKGAENFALAQYVNDRPYVASSFLSTALAKAFNTAMNGTCQDRPDLPDALLPLEATVAVVPAADSAQLHRLFAPLGYEIETEAHPLDPSRPEWGNSPYYTLRLRHSGLRLRDLLAHLYVLVPVLDNNKHYYIGPAEADKLLLRGGEWLPRHPEREFITRRYLRFAEYVNPTLARLLASEPEAQEEAPAAEAAALAPNDLQLPAAGQKLHDQRLDRVAEVVRQLGAKRVLDLGCGEGKLVRRLLQNPQVEHVLALDVSWRELERAGQRLHLAEMPPRQRERLTLAQGSVLYHDARLAGYDAAAVVEVIEHLDENRLAAFEQVVFARAQPGAVLVTTPNADYNQRYETLSAGDFRHSDHRFEWTRAQFAAWAEGVAGRHGYRVRLEPLGPEAAEVGAPSQLAVFER
ncbi:3' terminal RNA ribose 2'-O-methyltransferase Hen1 [Hymenobacter psychrotolerans]|uniref:Small RNA 2'-O-methyltransferase n=1 Tax=Hymenobacter psychrotolerans DSM 18569 TaxID=1121959 RepID=A0A1M6UMH8_9BACT|nr:3' terminal RNA ribose 2'-O-methyltransferase Hen1 [Hymenobacter psychrotolerans]SHK70310.1 3' terminal RNA ribose 2'-O-methyltransferase Hen1 [Hymenobacter psychrotolerans DSM 18569]